MNIVFKPIKTAGAFYVYDRSKNTIIKINQEEYKELYDVESGKIKLHESNTINKYKQSGFFGENKLSIIEHPSSNILEHLLSNHIEQLTIQVTQRCNLRCKYCIYSGIYEEKNRVHSNYDMDFNTAKKSIDFYLNRSMESKSLTFGFYGGEPLLKFDLIKDCVEYINSQIKDKKVYYTITTNGTLLTLEKFKFLIDNNFSILISMDGSKIEHDEYRIFPNGEGSFDLIIDNFKKIRSKYPAKFSKIRFNTVLNPKHDYKHLKLYFEEDELVGQSYVMMQIVDNKTADKVRFGDEFYRDVAFDRFKLYLFMLNKLDISYVSKLVLSDYAYIKQRYDNMTTHTKTGCKAHHGGPCVPGAKRLFINVFGELFPCERVGETSDVMKIGDLQSGFNYKKVNNLLNVGRLTEDHCIDCWALHYCGICCEKADGGDRLSREVKLEYCKNSKENAYYELSEVCVLREMGCTFNERGIGFDESINISYEL